MASAEPEATKSTTIPDEPATPEICDRPPEKHEQLSATAGNLTLSRPFTGFPIALCGQFKVAGSPKETLKKAENVPVGRSKPLIFHGLESAASNFSVFP